MFRCYKTFHVLSFLLIILRCEGQIQLPTLPPFYNETDGIPISFLEKLKDVKTTDEFLQKFVRVTTVETRDNNKGEDETVGENETEGEDRGDKSLQWVVSHVRRVFCHLPLLSFCTSPGLDQMTTTSSSLLHAHTGATPTASVEGGRLFSPEPPRTAAALSPPSLSSLSSKVSAAAFCEPRLQVVEIPPPTEHNLLYWPACVTLERCSGCCAHSLFSCKPSRMVMEPVTVLRARYPADGSGVLVLEGELTLPIERHLECECGCRTDESMCSTHLHDYLSCQCMCKNLADSAKCASLGKVWRNEVCRCVCPNALYNRGAAANKCPRGFYYSEVECSCKKLYRSDFSNITEGEDFQVVKTDVDGDGTVGGVATPATYTISRRRWVSHTDYDMGWERERWAHRVRRRPTPRAMPVMEGRTERQVGGKVEERKLEERVQEKKVEKEKAEERKAEERMVENVQKKNGSNKQVEELNSGEEEWGEEKLDKDEIKRHEEISLQRPSKGKHRLDNAINQIEKRLNDKSSAVWKV